MSLIKICISDDFEVDYDRDRGMYRVSVFNDGHFWDEYWFDAYEEKECSLVDASKKYLRDYSEEDMKKLFEEINTISIENQELLYKKIKENLDNSILRGNKYEV